MTDERETGNMIPAAERHLQAVKDEFCSFVDAKYRRGYREHGGLVADRTEMALIVDILEEAVDLVVYALVLKEKILARQI